MRRPAEWVSPTRAKISCAVTAADTTVSAGAAVPTLCERFIRRLSSAEDRDRACELFADFATVVRMLPDPLTPESLLTLTAADWAIEMDGLTHKAFGIGLREFFRLCAIEAEETMPA
jgi:hypothetical protein